MKFTGLAFLCSASIIADSVIASPYTKPESSLIPRDVDLSQSQGAISSQIKRYNQGPLYYWRRVPLDATRGLYTMFTTAIIETGNYITGDPNNPVCPSALTESNTCGYMPFETFQTLLEQMQKEISLHIKGKLASLALTFDIYTSAFSTNGYIMKFYPPGGNNNGMPWHEMASLVDYLISIKESLILAGTNQVQMIGGNVVGLTNAFHFTWTIDKGIGSQGH